MNEQSDSVVVPPTESAWRKLVRRVRAAAHKDWRSSVMGREGAGAAARATLVLGVYVAVAYILVKICGVFVPLFSDSSRAGLDYSTWTNDLIKIGLVATATLGLVAGLGVQRHHRERIRVGDGHKLWARQIAAGCVGGLIAVALLWTSTIPAVVSMAATVGLGGLAVYWMKTWRDARPVPGPGSGPGARTPTDAPAPPGALLDFAAPRAEMVAQAEPGETRLQPAPADVAAPALESRSEAGADVVQLEAHDEAPEPEDLDELLAELDEYAELDRVKSEIRALIAELRVDRKREELGLGTGVIVPSFRYEGPPGTGKTSIARLLTRILHSLGLLERGHLVELSRDELVGQYQGHSAPLMKAKINQAIGGVLFIDEAYSLFQGDGDAFGQEVINVLVKRVEDLRGQLVVVLAGYPDEMDDLMKSNSGLRSRFPKVLHFDGYSPEALHLIALKDIREDERALTPDADSAIQRVLEEMHSNADKHFGNGRAVRNLWQEIRRAQSLRCEPRLDALSGEDLREVTLGDVEAGYTAYRETGDRIKGGSEASSLILPGT